MKNKALFLIAILFILNSCQEDSEELHVFERGQIVTSRTAQSYTTESIQTLFSLIDPSLTTKVNYIYGVENYIITYETITPDGQETQASGLLSIPANFNTAAPLVSFQHGTILQQNAVPSTAILGTGLEIALMFGTEGYIVCMPDFLGLGLGNGLHPYMHAESEATVTIDMIRAAKNKLVDLGIEFNDQLFLAGYSQGGHVTMATHKLIEEEYADEFNITACSPMAGPFDVSGIMANLILEKQEYKVPTFLPYVLYSYNSVYNIYDDIESIFVTPYNSILPPYFNGENLHSLREVTEIMPAVPSDILTESAYTDIINKTNITFWDALEDNDLYDWYSTAPIHMFHCDCDSTIPMSNSEKALEYFLAKGITNVELTNPLEGGTHATCAVPSVIAAKDWFNTFYE